MDSTLLVNVSTHSDPKEMPNDETLYTHRRTELANASRKSLSHKSAEISRYNVNLSVAH